ncbi:hypothetical protein VL21_06635 [Stenotrophomonas maltophilia]|uniref:Uncharacterized protein n=1 Tax=Stenotrophomonas maltophilia TaxID=40324 RepID=A0AA40Y6C8_STEMA|nr:hypothetical protein [Stenotrophomonas muris]KOO85989.1 hypothetical protein VL21_06635 [Stenotrophomonas maltophilia]MBH1790490.1 hypothetical protein [Stenotrophomonas maltophilia]MCR1817665.1 hypothetical protein [Stenotrophomonas muris]
MNVEHIIHAAGDRSALVNQQRAAIALAATLETALTSTHPASGGGRALTFTFAGAPQLHAACDAWRAYALATIDTPAPEAATATQRLTAQIGLALFNDPTMDLTLIASLVTTARSNSQTALLPAVANEATEVGYGRG